MSDEISMRAAYYMEQRERDLEARIAKLEAALIPFAALYGRRWDDKDAAVIRVRQGGIISEMQAVSLGDVLRARDALGLDTEPAALHVSGAP